MNKKLHVKDCPFCGHKPLFVKEKYAEKRPTRYWVGCKNTECGIQAYTRACGSAKTALDLWNDRPNQYTIYEIGEPIKVTALKGSSHIMHDSRRKRYAGR